MAKRETPAHAATGKPENNPRSIGKATQPPSNLPTPPPVPTAPPRQSDIPNQG